MGEDVLDRAFPDRDGQLSEDLANYDAWVWHPELLPDGLRWQMFGVGSYLLARFKERNNIEVLPLPRVEEVIE